MVSLCFNFFTNQHSFAGYRILQHPWIIRCKNIRFLSLLLKNGNDFTPLSRHNFASHSRGVVRSSSSCLGKRFIIIRCLQINNGKFLQVFEEKTPNVFDVGMDQTTQFTSHLCDSIMNHEMHGIGLKCVQHVTK